MDLATVDKLLTTTRTVRKRLDLTRPVPRDVIAQCLDIAIQAPTGGNIPPFGGRFFSSRSETGSAHCYHDGIATTHVCRRKPCLAKGDY
jgi:nitroreductase